MSYTQILGQLGGNPQAVADGIRRGDILEYKNSKGKSMYAMEQEIQARLFDCC